MIRNKNFGISFFLLGFLLMNQLHAQESEIAIVNSSGASFYQTKTLDSVIGNIALNTRLSVLKVDSILIKKGNVEQFQFLYLVNYKNKRGYIKSQDTNRKRLNSKVYMETNQVEPLPEDVEAIKEMLIGN